MRHGNTIADFETDTNMTQKYKFVIKPCLSGLLNTLSNYNMSKKKHKYFIIRTY